MENKLRPFAENFPKPSPLVISERHSAFRYADQVQPHRGQPDISQGRLPRVRLGHLPLLHQPFGVLVPGHLVAPQQQFSDSSQRQSLRLLPLLISGRVRHFGVGATGRVLQVLRHRLQLAPRFQLTLALGLFFLVLVLPGIGAHAGNPKREGRPRHVVRKTS
jgi:hypothetical protein